MYVINTAYFLISNMINFVTVFFYTAVLNRNRVCASGDILVYEQLLQRDFSVVGKISNCKLSLCVAMDFM